MILRKGMWVVHKGKTCILIPEARGLTLHVVNAKGETVEVIDRIIGDSGLEFPITRADFTQAAYNDIPAPRRPTEQVAQRLGYL